MHFNFGHHTDLEKVLSCRCPDEHPELALKDCFLMAFDAVAYAAVKSRPSPVERAEWFEKTLAWDTPPQDLLRKGLLLRMEASRVLLDRLDHEAAVAAGAGSQ